MAAESPRPVVGRAWPGWTPGHFQVHFIYTGVAESMFLLFPDGTSMLLDCGDHAALTRGDLSVPVLPDPGRLAGDWIARYVRRVNPSGADVDYLFLSHFHSDHCGTPNWQSRAPGSAWWKTDVYRSGFALAAEQLHFRHAVDRGWPDYTDPIPLKDGVDRELDHMRKLYAYLIKRDGLKIEKFRIGANNQIVLQKNQTAFSSFVVQNICGNGRIVTPDGSLRDLYADFIAQKHPSRLNENGMSLGMMFRYGAFRFFTAGDFSDKLRRADGTVLEIEDALADVCGSAHVSKINHHGHYSMPARLVKALRSRVWISCVWDQLHDVDPVMARLSDRSLYPGDRLICPGVFPAERRKADAGKKWLADIAEESFEGGHVVLDVLPDGKQYTVSYLSARDESMTVCGVHAFTAD